jgi:hypothetical protein
MRVALAGAAVLATCAVAAAPAGAASAPSLAVARTATLRVARHAAERLPAGATVSPVRCRRRREVLCRTELRTTAVTPVRCALSARVTRARGRLRVRLASVRCRAARVAPPAPVPAPRGDLPAVPSPQPPDQTAGALVAPAPRGGTAGSPGVAS